MNFERLHHRKSFDCKVIMQSERFCRLVEDKVDGIKGYINIILLLIK